MLGLVLRAEYSRLKVANLVEERLVESKQGLTQAAKPHVCDAALCCKTPFEVNWVCFDKSTLRKCRSLKKTWNVPSDLSAGAGRSEMAGARDRDVPGSEVR